MAVRLKVCGITRTDDAVSAAEAGASAIGVVFWAGSSRCVTAERAAEIAEAVAGTGVTVVGVFVDQPPRAVQEIARAARLGAIQLHGHEEFTPYQFGMPILKSFGVGSGWHVGMLAGVPRTVLPLLDARDDQRKGGTGRAIDWHLAAAAAKVRPVMLAGGLTPENVSQAIEIAGPYGLDVSSGVESRPGIKDSRLIHSFANAVREAGGEIPRGLFT